MSCNQLANALEPVRDRLKSIYGSYPEDTELRDAADLIGVLQRILRGENAEAARAVVAAFGAPGDWGYHTPIGEAVLASIKEGTQS